MTDDQFKKFTKYIDTSITPLREDITALNDKVDDIYKALDYLVGETKTISDELGFHGKQTDESLENHEARISKLEFVAS